VSREVGELFQYIAPCVQSASIWVCVSWSVHYTPELTDTLSSLQLCRTGRKPRGGRAISVHRAIQAARDRAGDQDAALRGGVHPRGGRDRPIRQGAPA